MYVIAILGLAIVVAVTGLIGNGTNSAALLCAIIFVPTSVALYFSPAFVAYRRKHPNRAAIGVLNFALGWTVIGWVGALVWAHTGDDESTDTHWSAVGEAGSWLGGRESDVSSDIGEGGTIQPDPARKEATGDSTVDASKREMKRCPFCAEDIMAEAIKCKHCGSNLSINDGIHASPEA